MPPTLVQICVMPARCGSSITCRRSSLIVGRSVSSIHTVMFFHDMNREISSNLHLVTLPDMQFSDFLLLCPSLQAVTPMMMCMSCQLSHIVYADRSCHFQLSTSPQEGYQYLLFAKHDITL